MRKKLIKVVVSCLSALLLVGTSSVDAQAIELAKQKVGDVFKTDGGKFEVIKKTDIDEEKETGPFKVKVNYIASLEAELTSELTSFIKVGESGLVSLIAVHMTIENTSDDKFAIYPDQSVLIANKKQMDADMMLSADIGSEYYGNVEKEGIVYFIFDGDLSEVQELKMITKAPHDSDYYSIGEDIEFELKFKE